MKSAEVMATGPNMAVVKLADRKFPGVLVQGDSLSALCDLAAELKELLSQDSEAWEVASELGEQLETRLRFYEEVLTKEGISLPYNRVRD